MCIWTKAKSSIFIYLVDTQSLAHEHTRLQDTASFHYSTRLEVKSQLSALYTQTTHDTEPVSKVAETKCHPKLSGALGDVRCSVVTGAN
jgi:hypothetical protein